MLNSPSFLKRKLKNYRTLNKVGDVNMTRSLEALSEVQQRKESQQQLLQQTDEALSNSDHYYQHKDAQLVPELMGNQSLYVNALIADREKQLQQMNGLEQVVDEKLAEIFKLKKTNEVVQQKMQLAKQQMLEQQYQAADAEMAELLQNRGGGKNE